MGGRGFGGQIDLELTYAPTSSDRTYRFVASHVYELPFRQGEQWLKIGAGAAYRFSSARCYSVKTSLPAATSSPVLLAGRIFLTPAGNSTAARIASKRPRGIV